jgi:NADPH-dependent 7-cyano-7-deazaguanine reductase QueF
VIAEEAPDHVVRDGSSAESDESDEEDVGFQGNNMAYKSVEIDEGLMRDELESVKKHRFMVMSEVPNSLDFGLLTIDCLPFKEAVIEHCLLVEQELNNYLRNQFAEKMKSV